MNAIDRIRTERLVVLLRNVHDAERLVGMLADAGVGVVEVTLDSPAAEEVIARLRRRGDVTVLAGTVLTTEDVERAVAAGAEACVGPTFVPEVVGRCLELGVPAIPGALTPTEIDAARRAGAALVKLFPAAVLGPHYVRDLLGPLGRVPLLATGGVDAGNAAAFIEAGACAVAAGSAITGADDPLAAARGLVAAVRRADGGGPDSLDGSRGGQ
jgi:2-dehydro-3-deoxyphosphogluconate aldolase / (4S)-4-hydroxy-2-oxoglutarate aldolase